MLQFPKSDVTLMQTLEKEVLLQIFNHLHIMTSGGCS